MIAVPEVREDVAPANWRSASGPSISVSATPPLRGSVYGTEYLGTNQIVAVETAKGLLKARVPADQTFRIGETVGLELNGDRLSLFDGIGPGDPHHRP